MGFDRADTLRGSAEVVVEINLMMRTGHILLPNGLGLTWRPDEPWAWRRTSSRPAASATRSPTPRTASTSPHVSRR
jgi:hypothetical protein